MCYKTLPQIQKYSRNWKRLNPDWNIKLYDDELCKNFLLNEYSQLHLDIFNFIPDGPIKADFWRVCILNKYGGLYVDADIEPVVPLDNYIDDDDYFVTCLSELEPSYHLNPHFILSPKNNFILQKCINSYLELYNNKTPYKYWDWSIVTIFMKNIDLFKKNIKKKQSQIIFIDNKKYKFLQEFMSIGSYYGCCYNDIVVLHNRYRTYINHKFID